MRPGEEDAQAIGRSGIEPVTELPPVELPLYGPLEIPPDEEATTGGLTLDMAIERLVSTNLELRDKAVEIPKAQADILTASLRANPLLYADTQFIPYGGFDDDRPGGPTQYDLNITHPLDLSGKRKARTLVACRAKRVLEAQYQDAVRLQIDNLYTAFVDTLAARETVRFAQASVAGLNEAVKTIEALEERGAKTLVDVNRIKVQRDTAEVGLIEANEALRDAKRTLAGLLNIPPSQSNAMVIQGTIRDVYPPPPNTKVLTQMALAGRPDLVAYRLGIKRAEADVALARANRYEDVFLLYQPFTYQDTAPEGSYSWAVGVTVPLPLYNRNQGNIQRARLNASQTHIQLAERERQVIAEVEHAAQTYEVTHAAEKRYEQAILRNASEARDTSFQLFTAGEADLIDFLDAQREYNEVVRRYRDLLVRHRRSMLQINTVAGHRIFP